MFVLSFKLEVPPLLTIWCSFFSLTSCRMLITYVVSLACLLNATDQNFYQIIVMDSGRIVEQGTYEVRSSRPYFTTPPNIPADSA